MQDLPRESLAAFWMPFTANRQFKAGPRMLARANGMHYWTTDGRQILDGVAGLWCVNAGHGRREITEAVAANPLSHTGRFLAPMLGVTPAAEVPAGRGAVAKGAARCRTGGRDGSSTP